MICRRAARGGALIAPSGRASMNHDRSPSAAPAPPLGVRYGLRLYLSPFPGPLLASRLPGRRRAGCLDPRDS